MEFRILTVLQSHTLKALFDDGLGDLGFYLTGGTALSEFYLQHRYSDDLDLFTCGQQSMKNHVDQILSILTEHDLEILSSDQSDDFVRLFVCPAGKKADQLKIEFARDVPAKMGPAEIHGKVIVDSFEDIAVNKICAILNREPPEPKDFVDLLFIISESRYSVEYLMSRAKEKEGTLDSEYGSLLFATNLLRVEEFRFLPRMIKPLTLDALKSHLMPIAKDMVNRLRPERK